MSLAFSPASPRLESSYTSYNNRDSPARSSFSHDAEIPRSPAERSTRANTPYPAADSASGRADSALRNQHEPLDRAVRPEVGLAMERRRDRSVGNDGVVVEHSGQDHDRIDIEMEDAASEHLSGYVIAEEGVPVIGHGSGHGHQEVNDEMDTTPDASSSDGSGTPDPSVVLGDVIQNEAVPLAMDIVPGDLDNQNVEESSDVNPPPNLRPTTGESQTDTPESTQPLSITPHPQNPSTDAPARSRTPSSRLEGNGMRSDSPPPPANDNDSDGDSSLDDEDEHPYWANFQQDTSTASGDELAAIEARTTDISATDENHWKGVFFEDLEDPEHIVGADGRIRWLLDRFHGTPANPNREKFLRSPQIKIGDLWWNVKVFPRGNDGTEYVSIYIECSNRCRDSTTPVEEPPGDRVAPTGAVDMSRSWGSAAQIGCIMFNPDDPKVQYNAKSSHYFSNGNEDWGWVRFHGPWETIHRRQHEQMRPLLQNDSVEIVAYIRLVHDYTGSLWWHPPPQNQIDWDNITKTGYRGISSHFPHTSTLVAALAPWIHIRPFQQFVMDTPVPRATDKPRMKPRPLLEALKAMLKNLKTANRREDHDLAVTSDKSVSVASVEDAFGWHSWEDILKDGEVIGVWETLRHLLNMETSYAPNLGMKGPDVLDFVLTIRQRMLFEDNTHLAKLKIHSTQGILDDCVKGGSTIVPWDGVPSGMSLQSNAPRLLQMELPRQVFKMDTRKWMRSTHKIELDETIMLKQENNSIKYTLYAMIVHAGHLELASYYCIVRPRGPKAPWIQYGGSTQGDVKLLTKKQAIVAHQGTGESSEGVEPIAYVVMYIRSDCLKDMLPDFEAGPDSMMDHEKVLSRRIDIPNYKKPSYNPFGIINPWPKESTQFSAPETSTVYIFTSEASEGYCDRGFYDIWQLESQRAKVTDLELPRSTTIRAIRERLVTQYNLAAISEQCRLWLVVVDGTRSRWSLPLRQYKLDTTLQDIDGSRGVFYFWLHVIPLDSVLNSTAQIPGTDADQATASQPPPVSDALPDSDVAASTASSGAAHAAATGLAMLLDQIQQGHDGGPSIQSLVRTANVINEDVSMGGTQDQAVDVVPPEVEIPSQDPPRALLEDYSAISDVYVLVKSFDADTKTLKALGPFLVSKKDKIGEALERLHVTDPTKPYEVYCDEGGEIQSGRLKTDRTFEAEELRHGAVLMVQEKLSTDKMKEIKNRGDCSHILEYYAYLINILDPCLALKQYTRSYFGSEYFAMSLKNSLPYGPCNRIDMNGDSYSGSFVFGEKHGQGIMKYANGNVYTGEWEEDLPHGQGKMVYGTTKNVYEGGWKKGKRYGKGTMQYEVADEEEAICSICYDKEMDALLYRCGHVVACVDCARQVDICPVCRSTVESVVKIFRTM